MAKVEIKNDKLLVKLSFFEKIRALTNSFEVGFAQIRGVTEDSGYIKSGLGLRAPGTGFPGVIAEGTFYKNGIKKLSLWRRGQETVVIELLNSKWDRLIIGCINAKQLAQEINSAINK